MPKLFKIDRDVAKQIEEALFIFENLLDMDDKNLAPSSATSTAKSSPARSRVRTRRPAIASWAVCRRAAAGIRDEIESRGPMKLSEVLEAQKAMITVARNLAKEGTIMMGGGEDDYV